MIKANPALTRNREQIVGVLRQIGGIHRRAGRMSDAWASLVRAQEFAEGLAATNSDDPGPRLELAEVDIELSDLLRGMAKPSEAKAWLDKARTIVLEIVAKDTSTTRSQSIDADRLRHIGIALMKCGRPAEATAALRESIAIWQGQEPLDSNAAALYNRAAESLLSAAAAEAGSGLTDAEGRAAADKAMETLRRCVAAGWRDAGYMLLDTALTPIRSRRISGFWSRTWLSPPILSR